MNKRAKSKLIIVCTFISIFLGVILLNSNHVFATGGPGACIGADYNFTCGDTINQSCTMNGSISDDGNSCFYSATDDIVIDLNGYTLSGNKTNMTVGINSTGDNITIKNGIINEYYAGIFMSIANNSLVENISFSNNLRNAIYSENGTNNTYNDLWINNTWYDETYEGGSHCIYDNPRGESGLSVCTSTGTRIDNYTFYGRDFGGDNQSGTDSGLDIFASPNSVLTNIEIHFPDTYGIMIYEFDGVQSDGTNVTNYSLYGAKSDGKSTNDMIISGADNLTLINLYGENTTEWGPFINNAENTYINNITMRGANGVSIRLTSASYNARIYNADLQSSGWNFYLPSATNISIINATLTDGIAFQSDLLQDFVLDCARDNITINGGSSNNVEIMSGSNVTIRNCNLSNDGSYENIFIENNGYNISNNTISGGKYGIELGLGSIGTVSNNTINNHEDGIWLDNGFAGSITIEDNIINNTTHGAVTTENLLTNLTMSRNTISNSAYGIYFDDVPLIYGYPSNYIYVLDSEFSSNTYNGYTNENATLYFINNTLDNTNFLVEGTSITYNQHYLDVYVNYSNGTAVDGATVLAYANSSVSSIANENFNSDYYTYETNPYNADIGGGTWEIVNNTLHGFMSNWDVANTYINNNTYYSSTYKQVSTNFTISSTSPSGWTSVITSIDLQPDVSSRNYGCWEQLYGGIWYLGIYACNTYGCVSYDTVASDAGNTMSYDTEYQMIFTRNGSDFNCTIPGVSSVSGTHSGWSGGYEGLGVFTSNVTYDNTNITHNYYTYTNDYLYLNTTTNASGYIDRQNVTEYYYNATGINYYTNFTVNGTKTSYVSINDFYKNITGNFLGNALFLTLTTNPIVSNVYLSSEYYNEDITCLGTYLDPEGEGEAGSTFRWFVNGLLQSYTTKTINANTFYNGESVKCEYTPCNSISCGEAVNSTAIILVHDSTPTYIGGGVTTGIPVNFSLIIKAPSIIYEGKEFNISVYGKQGTTNINLTSLNYSVDERIFNTTSMIKNNITYFITLKVKQDLSGYYGDKTTINLTAKYANEYQNRNLVLLIEGINGEGTEEKTLVEKISDRLSKIPLQYYLLFGFLLLICVLLILNARRK